MHLLLVAVRKPLRARTEATPPRAAAKLLFFVLFEALGFPPSGGPDQLGIVEPPRP